MSLAKTYLIWLVSFALSIFVSIAFYVTAMQLTYGHIQDQDFEGLVCFIVALILIIFDTGIISGALVYKLNRKQSQGAVKRLAAILIGFHAACAVVVLVTIDDIFPRFIPIVLLILALSPAISWQLAKSKP